MRSKNSILNSLLIVVGKVGKVISCYWDFSLGDLKIAELEVTQTIKGASHLKRLCFLASSTWACDISNIRDEETVLLFLNRDNKWLSEMSTFSQENKILPDLLRQYLKGQSLFFITHSGGGKITIENNLVEQNGSIEHF